MLKLCLSMISTPHDPPLRSQPIREEGQGIEEEIQRKERGKRGAGVRVEVRGSEEEKRYEVMEDIETMKEEERGGAGEV